MIKLNVLAGAVALSFVLSSCIAVQPYPPSGGTSPPPPKPEFKWVDKRFNLGKNSFRVHVTGQSQDPKKYRICLRNSAGGKNKGMDWKNRKQPIFKAKKRGSISCNEYSPKKVNWKFYRIQGFKGYQNIGSYTFNAKRYAGKEITFDWIRD